MVKKTNEDQTEEAIEPATEIEGGPNLEDHMEAPENDEDDSGDVHELIGVGESSSLVSSLVKKKIVVAVSLSVMLSSVSVV